LVDTNAAEGALQVAAGDGLGLGLPDWQVKMAENIDVDNVSSS